MRNEPAAKGSSTWMLILGAIIIVLIVIVVVVYASAPSPDVNSLTPIATEELGGTEVSPTTDADAGQDTAEDAAEVEEALGNDTIVTEESGAVSPADG
ncbi:MAG: hypothetical protein H7175_11575 [Burkholderiales bacterium]|nr:hypothetical protein [Anaerolineae bacterium]